MHSRVPKTNIEQNKNTYYYIFERKSIRSNEKRQKIPIPWKAHSFCSNIILMPPSKIHAKVYKWQPLLSTFTFLFIYHRPFSLNVYLAKLYFLAKIISLLTYRRSRVAVRMCGFKGRSRDSGVGYGFKVRLTELVRLCGLGTQGTIGVMGR